MRGWSVIVLSPGQAGKERGRRFAGHRPPHTMRPAFLGLPVQASRSGRSHPEPYPAGHGYEGSQCGQSCQYRTGVRYAGVRSSDVGRGRPTGFIAPGTGMMRGFGGVAADHGTATMENGD